MNVQYLYISVSVNCKQKQKVHISIKYWMYIFGVVGYVQCMHTLNTCLFTVHWIQQ